MKSIQRSIAGLLAVVALVIVAIAYNVHSARSSDHQDTYNLAKRANTSADITDVFVFPSPTNSNNVVFVMNVSPLIPAGMGTAKFFDPTLMWQFKIAHGGTATAPAPEDQVIQIGVTGTDAGQQFTLYGPARPNEVGTTNTFVQTSTTGSFGYNAAATLPGGISVFAGPRSDPFFFDLFQFFSFLGDRNAETHSSQSDPGQGDNLFNGNQVGTAAAVTSAAEPYAKSANPATPTFNGFPAGTKSSATGYACSTNPSVNALTDVGGGFNVLTYVVEVPKSLITTGFSSSVIHVWATVNSLTGA